MWYSKVLLKELLQHCRHGKKKCNVLLLLPLPSPYLVRLHIIIFFFQKVRLSEKTTLVLFIAFKISVFDTCFGELLFYENLWDFQLEKVSTFYV